VITTLEGIIVPGSASEFCYSRPPPEAGDLGWGGVGSIRTGAPAEYALIAHSMSTASSNRYPKIGVGVLIFRNDELLIGKRSVFAMHHASHYTYCLSPETIVFIL